MSYESRDRSEVPSCVEVVLKPPPVRLKMFVPVIPDNSSKDADVIEFVDTMDRAFLGCMGDEVLDEG